MEVSYQGRLGWVSGRFLGPVDTVEAPPPTATATTRTAPAARPATLFEAPQQEAPVRQTRRAGSGFTCGGKRTCGQMNSCAEANFYLNQCGLYRLDRDGDGRPCESGPC
ncbi:excalibur calcium-binding domain-containing protein [Inquilinus limosus]